MIYIQKIVFSCKKHRFMQNPGTAKQTNRQTRQIFKNSFKSKQCQYYCTVSPTGL